MQGLSVNFIRRNIENIRGAKKPVSIEREHQKSTPFKHYSLSKNSAVDKRISELEKKLYNIENNYQEEII